MQPITRIKRLNMALMNHCYPIGRGYLWETMNDKKQRLIKLLEKWKPNHKKYGENTINAQS